MTIQHEADNHAFDERAGYSKPLSGMVPLDDEQRGGRKGRGSGNKTPFVAAVSVDEQGHLMRMTMAVIKGFRSSEIRQWESGICSQALRSSPMV